METGFKKDAPPLIDLDFVEKAEAEKGREAMKQMESLSQFPVELSIGEQRISVPKPSLAKILLFQKTYLGLLGKTQGLAKSLPSPTGENVGEFLAGLAAMEGTIFEEVVLLARIIVEPNQKGISPGTLSTSAEKIMEADEDQLIAILNLGFSTMRFDRVKKNLNLSP